MLSKVYILFVTFLILNICYVHCENVTIAGTIDGDNIELLCSIKNIDLNEQRINKYVILYYWDDTPLGGYSVNTGKFQ